MSGKFCRCLVFFLCSLSASFAVFAQINTPAPAFTADVLDTPPTAGWVTNGGSLNNQRFSPLTQINRDNVSGLKAEWRASLRGSGIHPRAGNQAQPIVHDGVIYIATGENDVFAISVETGGILWEYQASIGDDARPCCGWAVRGVGIGEGKVFVGRLDAKLAALDQQTGEVVWEIQAELPADGFSITSAPLYYNGMVITGFSGGDLGIRGRVKAYDAEDGSLIWTFYTVPAPGEFGFETWPQEGEYRDIWQYGGAAVWQTPAIDPELDMLYFSTSNPGPVLNGYMREGDNLFSTSIVAIDVNTGEYRWHFQEVHHDIWDYDAPNPVILFDAEYDGIMRRGIAQAGKTGWVYLLDRVTGEPLIGIEEEEVMQEPEQKTSPTQPFPIGDAVVPQELDMAPEGYSLVNDGKIFTPYTDEPHPWKPLAAVNWTPSSYSPDTRLIYLCATDSTWAGVGADPDYPVEPGVLYSGSRMQFVNAPRRGVFAAVDVRTNRIAWRQQWVDTCYSGSVATAGGLLFVGRNDGRLTAMDVDTGEQLWSFQTDGGVNATVSTFIYKQTQYVTVLAGGTSLAPTKKSDGLWLFSLNGTTESLPRGSADPNAGGGNQQEVALPEDREPDLVNGETLFTRTCVVCHGTDGQGGLHGGVALTPALTDEFIAATLMNGRNNMPAFGAMYSPEQMQDVAGFILQSLLPTDTP